MDATARSVVVFADVATRAEALWSLLYLAGYLTTDDTEQPNSRTSCGGCACPIGDRVVYRSEIIDRFARSPAVRDCLSTFTARWSTGTPTSSPRSWRTCC